MAFGLPANDSDVSHVLVQKDSSAQVRKLERRMPGPPSIPGVKRSKFVLGDIFIAVINATPYRWRRTHCHSYQLAAWKEERWPEYIEPGQAISHFCPNAPVGWAEEDTAAEVTYELEGTKQPASFNIQYRVEEGLEDDRFRIEILLKDGLKRLKTGRRADTDIVDLGFRHAPDGVSWMISGKEESFDASSNARDYHADRDQPGGWMQEILPWIGDRTLRELIMIRSHHGGLWKGDTKGISREHNCLTQRMDLGQQLLDGGVRVIDVRIYKKKDTFHAAHGTKTAGRWHGCIGEKVENLIETINRFNDENPGELIVLDFHKETFDEGNHHKPLKIEDRVAVYKLFQEKLHHRAEMPYDEDPSRIPIEYYIGNKTSSVILRFANYWAEQSQDFFPSSKHGFVYADHFPLWGRWTDTNNVTEMWQDQLDGLEASPYYYELFDLQWVLTPTLADHMWADDTSGVRGMAGETMPYLRLYLWNMMTIYLHPSWITLDSIIGREMRDLVKAMNYCFVGCQCGSWVLELREDGLYHA